MTFADISYYLNKGYQFPFPGKLLSAAPRVTLTHFSCSPNFPRASLTRYTQAKHEQILKHNEIVQQSSLRQRNSLLLRSESSVKSLPKSFTSTFIKQRNKYANEKKGNSRQTRKFISRGKQVKGTTEGVLMHFERSNERERPSLLFALNCRYSLVITLQRENETKLNAKTFRNVSDLHLIQYERLFCIVYNTIIIPRVTQMIHLWILEN